MNKGLKSALLVLTALTILSAPIKGECEIFGFIKAEEYPLMVERSQTVEQEMLVNGLKTKLFIYKTRDDAEKVIKFYQAFLAPKGWELIAGFSGQKRASFRLEDRVMTIEVIDFASSEVRVVSIAFTSKPDKDMSALLVDNPERKYFKKIIPEYPGVELINIVSSKDRKRMTLIFRSGDDLAKITNFYLNNLISGGWDLTKQFKAEELKLETEKSSLDPLVNLGDREKMKEILNNGVYYIFRKDKDQCVLIFVRDIAMPEAILGGQQPEMPASEKVYNLITIQYLKEGVIDAKYRKKF